MTHEQPSRQGDLHSVESGGSGRIVVRSHRKGSMTNACTRRASRTVKRLLLAMVGLVAVTGCYPAVRKEQPKLDVRIRDEHGHSIRDATVTFATYRHPFGGMTGFDTYQTDATGVVSIRRKLRWQMEALLPDGSSWYSWQFCVEKPGYQAFASAGSRNFERAMKVVLQASQVPSSCQWLGREGRYHDVRVVE